MEALKNWVQSRPNVAATATFTDLENIPEQVLCSAFVPISPQGIGLALWYCSPSTEQGVAYIPMNKKPGELEAAEQKLPGDSIAGWPRYFWIDPEKSLVVALMPNGAVRAGGSGLPSARRYLESYLYYFSPFVVCDKQESSQTSKEDSIKGWRKDSSEIPDKKLVPKFETQPLLLPGPLDKIRAQVKDIRKLVTSARISRNIPDVRLSWEKAMTLLGWEAFRSPGTDKLSLRVETDWRPTEDELEEIIMQWQHRSQQIGERVGVRLTGGSNILWFDSARCIDEVEIGNKLENSLHWRPRQIKDVIEKAEPKVRRLIDRLRV
jgi:hypothetical protein